MIPTDSNAKTPKNAQKIAKSSELRFGGRPHYRVRECQKIQAGRYRFVVRARIAGKWIRRYFEHKAPAQTWAQIKNTEILNQGLESVEFPSSLRQMARQCHDLLVPHGKTIQDATAHFLAFLEATTRSKPIGALVDELVAAKRADGASAKYLTDLKCRLERFAGDFKDELVASISPAKIDDWLRGLEITRRTGRGKSVEQPAAAVTRNNFRRVLIVAFNYARGRGYCLTNPAVTTSRAKEVSGDVGILPIAHTTKLLNAATPETLPYFALGCFAGLRPAELARLDWSEVDCTAGLIEVRARKSKTASRRFVKIHSNLAAWLAPYRLKIGPVVPINARKKIEAVRVAAKIGRWLPNGMRHSFASYHLAHFNDAAALALEMGHTDQNMIFQHYRQVVRPAEAEKYWQIFPEITDSSRIAA